MVLLIAVLTVTAAFFLIEKARRKSIKYYEDIRDEQDFTTERGRMIIQGCNDRIDALRYFENKFS